MNRYFVYTGNAYPHKNLARLIDAILFLNKNRKDKVKLKIVSGKNVFIERLKKEIVNKNAGKYVEILGFVSDKDLEFLYKNSAAFVFPTLSEGFGLPPMEAINAGTLAVVSNIPVLHEIYAESVSYFDPLDVNSIVIALERTLDLTTAEKNKKIKYSQDFVKRYSWAKMARETLKVYEKEGRDSLRQG